MSVEVCNGVEKTPLEGALIFQVKNSPDGLHHFQAVRLMRQIFQMADGEMNDLVDHAFGESLNGLLLPGSQVAEMGAQAGDLLPPDLLQMRLQTNDGGHHVEGLQPPHQLFHLVLRNLLSARRAEQEFASSGEN